MALPLSAVVANKRDDDIAAYRGLAVQDVRLATVGYRLALANRSFCKKTERKPGWVLHDIAQYPDAEIAKAAFGFETPIQISGVVANGPAEKAGLLGRDGVMSLQNDEGQLKMPGFGKVSPAKSYARLSGVLVDIKALLAKNERPVTVTVIRANQDRVITVQPETVCASDFQIDTSSGNNAGADGAMVSVSLDLALYAADDAELAMIVAHEFSHNILQHRAKLDNAKISRGIGRIFGKNKRAILATEIEADRLSIWLMANAGYDPDAALRFSERCRIDRCLGPLSDGTHLNWTKRIQTMKAEIDLINASPKENGLVTPPLLVPQLP